MISVDELDGRSTIPSGPLLSLAGEGDARVQEPLLSAIRRRTPRKSRTAPGVTAHLY